MGTPFELTRFTSPQISVLHAGLARLITNYVLLQQHGISRDAHPELRIGAFPNGVGKFHQPLMDVIVELWKQIWQILGKGGRLRLTYFGTAACAFALRIALRDVRHRHALRDPGFLRTAVHLADRLERIAKRQRRELLATVGQVSFEDLSRDWRELLKWIRLHLVFCNHSWRPRAPGIFRLQRRLIEQWQQATRQELTARRDPVPPDRDLRRLIRNAVREVRRGRAGFSIRKLMDDADLARNYFAHFVFVRTLNNALTDQKEIHD